MAGFNVFPLILLYSMCSNYITHPVTERRSEFASQTIQLALPEVKSGFEWFAGNMAFLPAPNVPRHDRRVPGSPR